MRHNANHQAPRAGDRLLLDGGTAQSCGGAALNLRAGGTCYARRRRACRFTHKYLLIPEVGYTAVRMNMLDAHDDTYIPEVES